MMQHTQHIRIKDHLLDLVQLPEAAQEELVEFYEFLVYKYQRHTTKNTVSKQQVLSAIFDEANGILPTPYVFDREALHER